LTSRHRRALALIAGGAVGTAARLAVGEALATDPAALPWPTLAVNLVGAALLGFLLPRLLAGARSTQYTIPLLAIGGLGAFTTFSGFAVEIVQLADNGKAATAAVYATVSVTAGLALALAGRRLGERTA
jgi:CrcB protein